MKFSATIKRQIIRKRSQQVLHFIRLLKCLKVSINDLILKVKKKERDLSPNTRIRSQIPKESKDRGSIDCSRMLPKERFIQLRKSRGYYCYEAI